PASSKTATPTALIPASTEPRPTPPTTASCRSDARRSTARRAAQASTTRVISGVSPGPCDSARSRAPTVASIAARVFLLPPGCRRERPRRAPRSARSDLGARGGRRARGPCSFPQAPEIHAARPRRLEARRRARRCRPRRGVGPHPARPRRAEPRGPARAAPGRRRRRAPCPLPPTRRGSVLEHERRSLRCRAGGAKAGDRAPRGARAARHSLRLGPLERGLYEPPQRAPRAWYQPLRCGLARHGIARARAARPRRGRPPGRLRESGRHRRVLAVLRTARRALARDAPGEAGKERLSLPGDRRGVLRARRRWARRARDARLARRQVRARAVHGAHRSLSPEPVPGERAERLSRPRERGLRRTNGAVAARAPHPRRVLRARSRRNRQRPEACVRPRAPKAFDGHEAAHERDARALQ